MNTPAQTAAPKFSAVIDDAVLMAYADGQLPAHERQHVETQIAGDPRLQAKIHAFSQSPALARAAFAPLLTPVPDALSQSVAQAIARAEKAAAMAQAAQAKVTQVQQVAALESARESAPTPASAPVLEPVRQLAVSRQAANQPWYVMVATVACVAVGVMGYLVGERSAQTAQAAAPNPLLALTMEREQHVQWQRAMSQPSDGSAQTLTAPTSPAAHLAITATVRDAQGRLCREFQWASAERALQGVACHDKLPASVWQVQMLASVPSESSYSPASAQTVLDAYLKSLGASAILSPEQEAKALASLINTP